MTRLQEKIHKEIAPAMAKEHGYRNVHMAPKLSKVVINVGVRSDLKDPKAIEDFVRDVKSITGQAPVKTKAKKSISSFKIREGQVIGLMVTLRGARMYDFLEKLFNATLPRVRDFRGVDERGFDRSGNYTIGLRDQLPFPEISAESVGAMFGMQITLAVKARKPDDARDFIKRLGLPLKAK